MARFSAAFALATLSWASADHHTVEYRVRVRNLTYRQPFSPPLIVAHTKDIALFKEGESASDAVKLMAEDGDNSLLIDVLSDPKYSKYICGYVVDDGALFPGKTYRDTMVVDTEICGDNPVFSMVGMLINSNDGFAGIDSEDLPYSGAVKSFPPCFDAGTEENNELCSHMPGPACEPDSGNLEASPGEGFIHVQRGIHGIGDLAADVYDWRNPVAEVFLRRL